MPPYLLVVESDPELQRRIGDTLREANYELATEAEGAWAKRSVLIRPPDGIILDTSLADGSGFQVADALRADADTEKVPIVFVASRFRGAKHRTEARRRYAPAEYLTTPLDLDTLLARVLEAVPPRPTPAAAIPDYPAAAKLADTAQRRERKEVEAEARELAGKATELRGSLAREPFARLLQRIYTEQRTGALLLSRGRDQEDRLLLGRLPGLGALERAGRMPGADPGGPADDQPGGAGRIAAADARAEAAPGRDPGRDGRAVAAQPGARAGRPDGGEAVRGVLLAHGQLPLHRGSRGRPISRSAWSARPPP